MRSAALAVGLGLLASACGLSPAEPSDIESPKPISPVAAPPPPVFVLSSATVRRLPSSVLYTASYSFDTPAEETVTVQSLEFALLGPSGETYNTQNYGGGYIGSISGGISFVDANTARPLATRYRGRLTYVRSNGAVVSIESNSTITEGGVA